MEQWQDVGQESDSPGAVQSGDRIQVGARFSAPVQTDPGAHPPQSSVEVRERVELYLYSPSRPSWPVLGWHLRFPFFTLWRYKKENYLQKIKLALCLVIKSRCQKSFLLCQWEASGQFSTPCELLDLIFKSMVPALERTPRCLTRVYLTSCNRHVTASECVLWLCYEIYNLSLTSNRLSF